MNLVGPLADSFALTNVDETLVTVAVVCEGGRLSVFAGQGVVEQDAAGKAQIGCRTVPLALAVCFTV